MGKGFRCFFSVSVPPSPHHPPMPHWRAYSLDSNQTSVSMKTNLLRDPERACVYSSAERRRVPAGQQTTEKPSDIKITFWTKTLNIGLDKKYLSDKKVLLFRNEN